MEFDARVPIYLQIMEKLKKDIISGRLKPKEKMSSVRILANELRVNVNTIQRVYKELERDEVLFTQRGIGSFITGDEGIIAKIKQEMAYKVLGDFAQNMRELGYDNEKTLDVLKKYMEGEQDGTINS